MGFSRSEKQFSWENFESFDFCMLEKYFFVFSSTQLLECLITTQLVEKTIILIVKISQNVSFNNFKHIWPISERAGVSESSMNVYYSKTIICFPFYMEEISVIRKFPTNTFTFRICTRESDERKAGLCSRFTYCILFLCHSQRYHRAVSRGSVLKESVSFSGENTKVKRNYFFYIISNYIWGAKSELIYIQSDIKLQ